MESSLGMPEYKADSAWFLSPSPKTSRNFAWTPMWRWADTTQYLDEVTLACDSQGNKVVSFNGNGWHGRWFLDNSRPGLGARLHVELNVRGPDDPAHNKWVDFQNVPGSTTWIGIKDMDLSWSVILSALPTRSLRETIP